MNRFVCFMIKYPAFLFIIPLVINACASGKTQSSTSPLTQSLSHTDSLKADRSLYVSRLKEEIKGHEQEQVQDVFGNLQVLGGFPAENLIIAMDKWAEGLGVSCSHCHNTTSFSSDEKKQKDVARQMVKMNNRINDELLKNISGLKSAVPRVNCITCHRGNLKPSLKL
jgi:hypothetical protein